MISLCTKEGIIKYSDHYGAILVPLCWHIEVGFPFRFHLRRALTLKQFD